MVLALFGKASGHVLFCFQVSKKWYPISGAIIALDRQEQDEGEQVSKKLVNELNIPIFSISSLENLVIYLETTGVKNIAQKLKTSLKN